MKQKQIDRKLCKKQGRHITLDGMLLLGGKCDRCDEKESLFKDLVGAVKKCYCGHIREGHNFRHIFRAKESINK